MEARDSALRGEWTPRDDARPDVRVLAFYVGSVQRNQSRSEYPLARGWHWRRQVWDPGYGWSESISEEAYSSKQAAIQGAYR